MLTSREAMRIAVLGHSRSVVGGAETYLRWLMPTLVRSGHTLAFAFETDCADESRAVDRDAESLTRLTIGNCSVEEAIARVASFAPDLVFTHGLDRIDVEFALSVRYPTLLFAHAFYGACATGQRRHAFPDVTICRRPFGVACLGVNYFRQCGARRPDRLLRAFNEQRDRSVNLGRFRRIVVASGYMRSVYEAQGIETARLSVVPYPTLELRPDADSPAAREPTHRLLFLGRVTRLKGLDHAIQATRIAGQALGRELTLCVGGEGPELERSLALAQRFGVRVEATGWIDGERKLGLLRSADLLLLPSTWPEPFGIVGIEAACVGLPTVAYGVGGVMEWLSPGYSGELAISDPLHPELLAAAIVRALAPANHQRLRLGAWTRAAAFSPERHITQIEGAFRDVLEDSA